MAAVRRGRNLITAAIDARRENPFPPLQVANGYRALLNPGPQVADDAAIDALNAAWLPTIPGQAVPMLGEAVFSVESGDDL